MVDLRLAAARYVLGTIPSWELPGVADGLLDQGRSSRAVIDLATLRQPTMAEAGPLLERVLQEEGLAVPSVEDAVWTVLRYEVGKLARDDADPRGRLRGVVDLVNDYEDRSGAGYVGSSYGLEHLVGAYWGYDDLDDMARIVTFQRGDEARRELDDVVRQRASQWMETYGSPSS